MRRKAFCKFLSIIGLNTFYRAGKGFYKMLQKTHGGVGTVFFKSFHKTPAGVFVNSSVLIELLTFCLIHKACRGYKLYIKLYVLTGMIHSLIRLWNVFRIRRFYNHHTLFSKKSVKPRDRAGIAALHEFDHKNLSDETQIISLRSL